MYVGQKKSDVFVEKYKGSGIALSRAIEIKNLHIGNNQFKERNLKCQTQFGEYKFSYKIEDTEVNN